VPDDDQVTSQPTYFGREHEAVRHAQSDASLEISSDATSGEDSDDDLETTTFVTTLGIVLTIPKES
jgi:hypothetical protein